MQAAWHRKHSSLRGRTHTVTHQKTDLVRFLLVEAMPNTPVTAIQLFTTHTSTAALQHCCTEAGEGRDEATAQNNIGAMVRGKYSGANLSMFPDRAMIER